MPSFWITLAAGSAIFAVCLWWVRRPQAGSERFHTPIVWEATPQSLGGSSQNNNRHRGLKSISFAELRLLRECDHGCILVDIRSNSLAEPADLAGIFVVPISPRELPDVLGWLPVDRVVAFHGVSHSSFALIEASECMNSVEPRCLLRDLPDYREAK